MLIPVEHSVASCCNGCVSPMHVDPRGVQHSEPVQWRRGMQAHVDHSGAQLRELVVVFKLVV